MPPQTTSSSHNSSDAVAITSSSYVTLHYRLSALVDGVSRDLMNTFDGPPATLQMGSGQLAPTIEAQLIGVKEGDEGNFELPAGTAYGERQAELVQTISRSAFNANADTETQYIPGDVIEFNAPEGRRLGGVLKQIDDRQVVVDFNHPLAGLALTFSFRVIGVL